MTTEKYAGFFSGKNIQSFIGYKAVNKEAAKLVDQIWLSGSLSIRKGDTAKLHVNILLADGNKKEFVSSDIQNVSLEDLLKKADDWIDNLITNANQ